MGHFFRPSEALDKSLIEVGDLICRKFRVDGKTYDWFLVLVDDNEINVLNGQEYAYMVFMAVGDDFQVHRFSKTTFLTHKNIYLVAKADKSATVNP